VSNNAAVEGYGYPLTGSQIQLVCIKASARYFNNSSVNLLIHTLLKFYLEKVI